MCECEQHWTDLELDQTVGFYYGGVALSNNITAGKFLDDIRSYLFQAGSLQLWLLYRPVTVPGRVFINYGALC